MLNKEKEIIRINDDLISSVYISTVFKNEFNIKFDVILN